MTATPPSYGPASIERLRNAAMRLAAELDEARFFQAAAHVSMGADAINRGPAPELTAAQLRTDIELEFEFDEHGRVWMIREGDCHIIGRTEAVCLEMRKFLANLALGRDR
ncbi:MAG TPA: hypothetical protein VF650_17335 [Allosphingosinicella sp.]|jgi:hypothetical protein